MEALITLEEGIRELARIRTLSWLRNAVGVRSLVEVAGAMLIGGTEITFALFEPVAGTVGRPIPDCMRSVSQHQE